MTAHNKITHDPADLLMEIMRELSEIKQALARVTIQPAPEWQTVRDAAKWAGVTDQTIRRRVAAGQIEAKGSGKLRMVRL